MKNRFLFLLLAILCVKGLAQPLPDPSLYPDNMTLLAVITVDGDEQRSTALEVSAFCGTECRGVGNPIYCEPVDRYILPMVIYGTDNDEIHFILYDPVMMEELEADSTCVVTFQADGYGTIDNPMVLAFSHETPEPPEPPEPPMPTTYTQQIEIGMGWNWWSTPLDLTNLDGLAMLQDSLRSAGILIKSNTEYTSYSDGHWDGSLTAINNENMYMINARRSLSFEWIGDLAEVMEHPIQINNGWNWISYLPTTTMAIEDAFVYYSPNVGDLIKSNSAFAVYTEDGWDGTLTELEPGKGYMYLNVGASATLIYP